MKFFLHKITLVLSFLTFFSCVNKAKNIEQKLYKAGVVISFDDAYVDEWFDADKALKKYDWKATFCVCRIESIGAPQINKLLELQKDGHEIAGHGYHHYKALQFVKQYGMDEYIKQEINPMLVSMKQKGFIVSSFAYPYGQRSNALDTLLSTKFKIIRGRDFTALAPEKEGSYFRNSKFMYAFDIDNNHIHFSTPYLLELLDNAKKNNKILILCGHKPVKKVTANYQTKIETLEFICKYVKANDMRFYKLSDLDNLQNSK
jgi:peptidoglycan/xylan/chitin deacetylase (PgdA/CDA1 family)